MVYKLINLQHKQIIQHFQIHAHDKYYIVKLIYLDVNIILKIFNNTSIIKYCNFSIIKK